MSVRSQGNQFLLLKRQIVWISWPTILKILIRMLLSF